MSGVVGAWGNSIGYCSGTPFPPKDEAGLYPEYVNENRTGKRLNPRTKAKHVQD
jgi:hypothetical protein